MEQAKPNPWLHAFALCTAFVTLVLIAVGGLVTSHEAGMAVPDWPNSYGYNMFLFPISKWVGGILYEHTHRLIASTVGLLVVALTRWIGGRPSRLPLILIGVAEVAAGLLVPHFWADWKAAGYFLSGIGGLVLLAGIVWVRNRPAKRPLPLLVWIAFGLVQAQGLLGGLRVVLMKYQVGIYHAALAQIFFSLLCVIALLTAGWWRKRLAPSDVVREDSISRSLVVLYCLTTALIFGQLLLGATMRHQHAGLSIPDFPLAYGKWWPAMDAQSVQRYNEQRLEIVHYRPITAAEILLQMVHRMVAGAILLSVAACAALSWRRKGGMARVVAKFSRVWLCLVIAQAGLGAWTIWSGKAADIATAHVVTGALLLASGAMLSVSAAAAAKLARTVPFPASADALSTAALSHPAATANA
ncbi:MAG TPA: COX15/CtaA family protein [Verrucomicrobiae bacterium]|nr:COX15/CtaA family protein [Verrucomicrobiae bacterium]